jgi:hypothetical protein
MKSDSRGSHVIGAAGVFSLTAMWLWWMAAHRFSFTYDEGIYVEGARRILAGEAPYRDFFALMGPGTFWLQALALRVFGMTLAASRTVMILDVAVLATCVYWLIARRVGIAYAAWCSAALVILETANQGIAIPSHRWDSAALAVLAVTICASGQQRYATLAAGCCAAFAAWTTPPVVLVTVAILIWLVIEDRVNVIPYLAGCAAVSIGCITDLVFQGALRPMIEQALWDSSHYGGANYLPYGTLFGRGYGQFFTGAASFEIPVRAIVMLGFILPVILPPIAALCFPAWRKSRDLRLIFLGGAALVCSTYPRMDLPHLTYTAPLFYALLAILGPSIPWPQVRGALFAAATLLIAVFAFNALAQHSGEQELQTQVGTIRALPEDASFVRDLDRAMPKRGTLFVFPYLPIASFLTLSRNPTRYSYLQPAMMSARDETEAIAELRRCPPAKVLYFNFDEQELLSIWPASDPARLRFRDLEAYLSRNYRRTGEIQSSKHTFEILEPE